MAEKRKLAVFTPTTGGEVDNSDLDQGRILQSGVGLKEGEMQALDAIGKELGGIARNALMRYAVRRLIIDYRAGRLNLEAFVTTPPEPKKTLEMPSE